MSCFGDQEVDRDGNSHLGFDGNVVGSIEGFDAEVLLVREGTCRLRTTTVEAIDVLNLARGDTPQLGIEPRRSSNVCSFTVALPRKQRQTEIGGRRGQPRTDGEGIARDPSLDVALRPKPFAKTYLRG